MEYEVGRTCSTCEKLDICGEYHKGRTHLEGLSIGGIIIIKFLKETGCDKGAVWIHTDQDMD
jgi:hypothetical protein